MDPECIQSHAFPKVKSLTVFFVSHVTVNESKFLIILVYPFLNSMSNF